MTRVGLAGITAAAGFAVLTVVVWRRVEPLPSVDTALHSWAITTRNETTIAYARAVTQAGSTYVAVPVIFVAGWIGAAGRRPALRLATAAILAGVAALGAAAGLAVNAAVNGVRPGEADWMGAAGGPTYPSGHTTVATLLAAALAWAVMSRWEQVPTPAVIAGAVALAFAVGVSRVWLGVHWPSDVLGGWLFGAAWAALALDVARAVRRRRAGPTPTDTSGQRTGGGKEPSPTEAPAGSRTVCDPLPEP